MEEELEKKAEDYAYNKTNDFYKLNETYKELKHNTHTEEVNLFFINNRNAYKDGYEQGQKDFDTKVTKLLNSYGVTFIDTNSIGGLIALHQIILDIEKENEQLKYKIAGLLNNIDGQKARKKHHIKENVKLTREVEELKAQIEKMKCCENCKYHITNGWDSNK